ncbi:DgyrCDS8924 [Dimorphilus gyrociliatus]|uniref:DgyrCDS8924 n=1 Tax=Dimorphilus gyrociliatus TaxID=2664684 RepID=A0A7I8VVJ3_9ANNE|nr:DgyrCDS8924 [Dimorphilus gyrociliatus]
MNNYERMKYPVKNDHLGERPLTSALNPESMEPLMIDSAVNMLQMSPNIVYPTIYVSPIGVMTILLNQDLTVELTINNDVRVVNPKFKTVAFINSKRSYVSLYHPAGKIIQDASEIEMHAYWDRRAKLCAGNLIFAQGNTTYKMRDDKILTAEPQFRDLRRDPTMALLLPPNGHATSLNFNKAIQQIVKQAQYRFYRNGALSVCVNNVRVFQSARGDVSVTAWSKVIRTSPMIGSIHIETDYMTTRIDANWVINIQRGRFRISAGRKGFSVSNGVWESGFSPEKRLYTVSLDPYKRSATGKRDNKNTPEDDLEEINKSDEICTAKNRINAEKKEDTSSSVKEQEKSDTVMVAKLVGNNERTSVPKQTSINGRMSLGRGTGVTNYRRPPLTNYSSFRNRKNKYPGLGDHSKFDQLSENQDLNLRKDTQQRAKNDSGKCSKEPKWPIRSKSTSLIKNKTDDNTLEKENKVISNNSFPKLEVQMTNKIYKHENEDTDKIPNASKGS